MTHTEIVLLAWNVIVFLFYGVDKLKAKKVAVVLAKQRS